jgi:hypothetical protein
MFPLNYKNKFEIDTLGHTDPTQVAEANWARLAAGINTFTPAAGDTTDNTPYFDGNGFSSTDVTGKNYSIAFSGNRLEGDAAQDYVASKDFAVGDAVKTLLRWTRPDGTVIIGCVTLNAIVVSGGAANAKETFSFTSNFNGAPTVTSGLAAPTGLAGTVTGTSIALTWNAVSGAASYKVYRNGILSASPVTNAYTDSGLAVSTSYSYQVSAVDENGEESVLSAPVSKTTAAS